jgi:hypothetical protein
MRLFYIICLSLLASSYANCSDENYTSDEYAFNKGRIYQYVQDSFHRFSKEEANLYKSDILDDGTLILRKMKKNHVDQDNILQYLQTIQEKKTKIEFESSFDKDFEIMRYKKLNK